MNRKINIHIASIKTLYHILESNKPDKPIVAILCTEYPINEAKLNKIKYLHISFEDITEKSNGKKFTLELAESVRTFIDKLDDSISDLFFCCDSGESRSSALATAYMRYYNMNEMKIWKNPHYQPNSYVYAIQCKALNKPISKIGLKYRTYINKQALTKAIKQARKSRHTP